ncbi:thiamine pyrophosphate-binding protein [Actinomadura fibrosa]|uniref:Thiamine pyrophosphate-binding protein n=1 Tax=Actinomadura fibrosa TaxID=111802 RepID=A0ABW2XQU1_9ACTN|nr:thiamine pyrophosphate-binding protein [Actinomadura fibrosa]
MTPVGAVPGKVKLIEQFAVDGLRYMFGNPGTVEQGFLDVVERSAGLDYVLALQETVAAGMADGYARATGGPALLQLHTGVGLGNGIGMLYQSMRGHTPLLVVAGEAGVRYEALDGQMAADLVAMARPVTKYATRVTDPRSVLRIVRRALKIAMTPPRGPVFVALPMDVLDEPNDEPVVATSVPSTDMAPAPATAARAAALLAAAERPLILTGDEIALAGAQPELVRVAETLGADVWSVDSSEVNMPASHPLSRGQLGHMFGARSRAVVAGADAVLIAGTYVFPEVFPELDDPFADGARTVHISLDPYEIAKNFPVDVGVVADPKRALAAIGDVLADRLAPDRRAAARRRLASPAAPAGPAPDPLLDEFCRELARRAGDDLIVFDEALTASPTLTAAIPPDRPGSYFATRGGSLGVGGPGAVGIKLARPGRRVVAFVGDGAAMYTYQALWTAARYGVDVTVVVCNNGRYRLLDDNIEAYWRDQGAAPRPAPSFFDLRRPEIDFAGLARSLGAGGVRVQKPREVAGAVERALAASGPFVVDIATGLA